MNTYTKYYPNVFLAKCEQEHQKGDIIPVTTQYGKENDSIVFNLVVRGEDGFFYYSIIRADGFNVQEWALRRAEKAKQVALNASKKSDAYYKAANKDKDFLSLGEPIKVGHHSEKRHRKTLQQANDNMFKFVEFDLKSSDYKEKAAHWESKASVINLSMPESLEMYEFKLEEAKAKHQGLKDGSIEKRHSYSLTYAKKEVNELTKKLEISIKLWGEQ